MGYFDAFRDPPAQTQYGPQYVPVTVDVLIMGFIVACAIVLFAVLVIALGNRSVRSGVGLVATVTFCLLVTLAILVCIFDPHWKRSSTTTSFQYRAHQKREIRADVEVRIGLRGLNVTLKGRPVNQLNETIDYNERFSWAWNQGRLGFGPYAGRINREFRAAQYRGLPLPVQWVVEYFTLDGEEIRWGRAHREAGYYTNMTMWTAFAMWALTLILFRVVVPLLGAISLAITGTLLLVSNIIYSVMSSSPEPKLVIRLGSSRLDFSYGHCFWTSMVTGIVCLLLAVVCIIMDYRFPRQLAKFLNKSVQEIDVSTDLAASQESLVEPPPSVDVADIENGGSFPRQRRMTSSAVSFRLPRRKPSAMGEVLTPRYLPKPNYVNLTEYQDLLKSHGLLDQRRQPLTSTSSLPVEQQPQKPKSKLDLSSFNQSSVPNMIPMMKSKTTGDSPLAVVEESAEIEEDEM